MIKEKIEEIPGGKEYIETQIVKGITIGLILGIVLGSLLAILGLLLTFVIGIDKINVPIIGDVIMIPVAKELSKLIFDRTIRITEIIDIVAIIIFVVTSTVIYYYGINKAYSKYAEAIEKEKR